MTVTWPTGRGTRGETWGTLGGSNAVVHAGSSPGSTTVTLGELLQHSVPQFPHLENGGNNSIYPMGLCED